MSTLVDTLNSFWRKKKPEPTPVSPDAKPNTGGIPWLRVGILLKSIPFKKLAPAFLSIPVIVFFAVSGLLAWIMLFLRFAVNIFTVGQ